MFDKMSWDFIQRSPNENLQTVKARGTFDMDSNAVLIRECLEIANSEGCRAFLIDNRGLEFQAIKTLEIYSIPSLFSMLKIPRTLHIALVFSEKDAKAFHFLETVCHNTGYSVFVFADAEAAERRLTVFSLKKNPG